MLYLDANATEPVRHAAREAALAAMNTLGNPSSTHAAGRAARKLLEEAREAVAQHCHSRPQDVVFTSGATEANALAIHALGVGRPVLTGTTEHDSIRAAAPDAVPVPVLVDGTLDFAALNALLTMHPDALLCLMAANNETGVLHDIAAAGRLCAAHGALLHVDAVQAIGRCNQDWLALGAASFALSGHKFGGVMGAGALVTRKGLEINPLMRGGGQELGRRGGTPPLPAIAALAVVLGEPYEAERIAAYRDAMEAAAIASGAVVMGAGAPRLPNTICLALPGVRADTQLIALDMAGIAVSAGSACSSGKVTSSHVLAAMGQGELAGQAIRVSLPWDVTEGAVERFAAAYATMAKRALRPQAASA
ncbi:cysteine desulfurase family protein [Acidocella aromatica]|uniref:Cysteine desulfurase n=1 Tax=Acidocella aromatica TaxID=1303579 RepID=A0A840VK31_9PROT|nr:cysteine desulfurase family protein [Acidocella aromatica]MBB5371870.1 cysteine desulfurase [Acidocella aromatica]